MSLPFLLSAPVEWSEALVRGHRKCGGAGVGGYPWICVYVILFFNKTVKYDLRLRYIKHSLRP